MKIIQERVIMDIGPISIKNYVKACKSTMEMIIDSLEDETDKKEIDEAMKTVKIIRTSLLGPISIIEYINLLKEQVHTFKKLKVTKKLITKHLSWIDSFITMYPGFNQKVITSHDIDIISKEIEFRCHQNDPKLIPFDMSSIMRECCTPTLSCVNIEYLLSKCFVGPYHNNPIIYLPLTPHKGNHWSFYVLKEIKNGIRLWVIDHSLIKTSDKVGTALMMYMFQLFRTLHMAAFGDNDYRPGFIGKTPLGPLLKTLIKNMLIINNKSRFREYLAWLVINKSTIIATDMDVFNSQQNTMYNDVDMVSMSKNEHKLVKSLFDNKSKYSISFLTKDLL
jgi:hypothetical protein